MIEELRAVEENERVDIPVMETFVKAITLSYFINKGIQIRTSRWRETAQFRVKYLGAEVVIAILLLCTGDVQVTLNVRIFLNTYILYAVVVLRLSFAPHVHRQPNSPTLREW